METSLLSSSVNSLFGEKLSERAKLDPLTLLRSSVVRAGAGVGCVLCVPGGGAVPRPIKIIVLVLGKHADRLFLKAAVELPWRLAESTPGRSRHRKESGGRHRLPGSYSDACELQDACCIFMGLPVVSLSQE